MTTRSALPVSPSQPISPQKMTQSATDGQKKPPTRLAKSKKEISLNEVLPRFELGLPEYFERTSSKSGVITTTLQNQHSRCLDKRLAPILLNNTTLFFAALEVNFLLTFTPRSIEILHTTLHHRQNHCHHRPRSPAPCPIPATRPVSQPARTASTRLCSRAPRFRNPRAPPFSYP